MKKKILFIENRTNIFFYNLISKILISKNIEVHWLIQNKIYKPECGIKHIIDYPSKDQLKLNFPKKLINVSKKDRNINYYNGNTKHYNYYYYEIKKIVKKIKPDLIIGETSLFHELITLEISKDLKFLYLFPSPTRFANKKISFYKFGSPNLYKKKNIKSFKKIKVKEFYEKINNNEIYKSIWHHGYKIYINKIYFWALNLIARIQGEKFNTPSVFSKFTLELKKLKLKFLWKLFSIDLNHDIFNNNKLIVLYPLQMQPEANLDVWGFPYRDQFSIVKNLAKTLKNEIIIVKPNPKFKYEVSNKLIQLSKKYKNIYLMNSKILMADLLKKVNIVFSLTGSILFECVIKKKPAITLMHDTKLFQFDGIKKIKKYSDLNKIVKQIKKNKFVFSNEKDLKKYCSYIEKNTFDSIEQLDYSPSNYSKSYSRKFLNNFSNILINFSK